MKKLIVIILGLVFLLSCGKDNATEPEGQKTEILFSKFVPYKDLGGTIRLAEVEYQGLKVLYDSIIVSHIHVPDYLYWQTPYYINTNIFSEIQLKVTIAYQDSSVGSTSDPYFYYGFNHNSYFGRDSIPNSNITHFTKTFPEHMFTKDSLSIAFKIKVTNIDDIKMYDFQIIGTRKN